MAVLEAGRRTQRAVGSAAPATGRGRRRRVADHDRRLPEPIRRASRRRGQRLADRVGGDRRRGPGRGAGRECSGWSRPSAGATAPRPPRTWPRSPRPARRCGARPWPAGERLTWPHRHRRPGRPVPGSRRGAVVEVEVALRDRRVRRHVTARARARAGPADPPLMPPPTPLGDTRAIPDSAFRNPVARRGTCRLPNFCLSSRRAVGGSGRAGGRRRRDARPAETITCSDVGAPAARVHRRHRADRRPSLAWRATTGPTGFLLDGSAHAGPATTMSLPSLRWGRRVPRTPTPDRLHRAAAAAGRLGPRRADRRRPKHPRALRQLSGDDGRPRRPAR